MFHEDGASTEVTSTLDLAKASITGPNGSLTSPLKLNPISRSMRRQALPFSRHYKPKIASTTWSVSSMAEWKSSTNGMFRFFSCVDKRCGGAC